MTIEERVAELEAQQKKSRKDGWDVFQILAGLLIPASIAIAGYQYSSSMKDAEIQSSDLQAQRQAQIAAASARVSQAGVVSSFLDALLSDNPVRRKLAVQAVMIALPEDGPNLVKIVSETDADPQVKLYADNSLERRRKTLVSQLYSDNATDRTVAADQLTRGWKNDPKLVDALAAAAQTSPTNANGVYNSVVVMQTLDPDLVRSRSAAVKPFLDLAKTNGEKTRLQAERLRVVLDREPTHGN
jgi:hypothetical protein